METVTRYWLHRTLRIPLAILAMLGLASCVSGPRYVPIQYACASRVPPQLTDDVPSAALPTENTVGQWVAFGDAQTGQLERANDEKQTALWIVNQCEAEAKAAADDITKPWFVFWR